MAEYASLELKVENNVGHLVLNRPESLNAVSPQILSDLDLVCGEIESNKEIRAVVLSGAGKSFCAGADLKHVMGVRETPGGFEKFARYLRSEEHTSELQSLMRISYAVFCWKQKNN